MNKKQMYNILLRSSGLILLILILLRLYLDKIVYILSNIIFLEILPVFLLFLCIMYLRAQRFKILLVNSGINIADRYLSPYRFEKRPYQWRSQVVANGGKGPAFNLQCPVLNFDSK